MKDITRTRFTKIGTNPNTYINNFISYFNAYNQCAEFEVDGIRIVENNNEVFSCNSDTTFKQNIQC